MIVAFLNHETLCFKKDAKKIKYINNDNTFFFNVIEKKIKIK